jgi:crossover junction endodeoxyribonuclease RusA
MSHAAARTELRLVLPLPPSINHQYATVQGRRVLSRAGREYKALVAETLAQWLDEQHGAGGTQAFQQHYLALRIIFYFATALRRDLDGGLKIAQDALCEALGVNDNLVVEIHLSKRVDRQQPRMELQLTALSTETVDLGAVTGEGVPALPARLETSGKKRRRKKPRSLEELTARLHWQ